MSQDTLGHDLSGSFNKKMGKTSKRFYLRGNCIDALEEIVARANNSLREKPLSIELNGEKYKLIMGVSYGIAEGLGEAEVQQKLAKQRRLEEGKRARGNRDGAGSQLRGLGEVTAEGRQPEGSNADDNKVEGGGIAYELPNPEIQRESGGANSTASNSTSDPGVQDEPEVYYAAGAQKEKRTAFQAKIGIIKTDVERVFSPASAARILAPLGKKNTGKEVFFPMPT